MNFEYACSLIGVNFDTPYSTAYRRFRKLAKQSHPDKGGTTESFQQIKEAWDTVKSALPKRKTVDKDMSLRRVTLCEYKNNKFVRNARVSCSILGETVFGIYYIRVKKGVYKIDDSFDFVIPEIDSELHDGVDCRVEFLTVPCKGWERWCLKRKGE